MTTQDPNPPTARQRLRDARLALDAATHRLLSSVIVETIQSDRRFKWARNIGLYWPSNGEVDLLGLQTRTSQTQYLPVLQENIYPWAGKGLMFANKNLPVLKNRFGIPEPNAITFKTARELDYLLIPLVGFDRLGNRLGMGAGYYDRALSNVTSRTYKLGVAFSCQELPRIEPKPWDITLDAIVTEREFIVP
jgi:5-formyltetrahydrofolate cyclo-ligase